MYEGNPHSLQILSIFLFLLAISETRYDFLTIQNTLNCFKLTSKSLKQIILYNLLHLLFLCKALRRYSEKRNVSSDVHSSSFYSIVICVCFSTG